MVYGMRLFAEIEADKLTSRTGKLHVVRLLPNGWQWRVNRVLSIR